MRTPLPMRRLIGGMPSVLLAVLLVLARLLAPAMAMPSAGSDVAAFDHLVRQAICHVTSDEAGAPAKEVPAKEMPTGHGECPACPACHIAAAAVLPVPAGPHLPVPTLLAIGLSAPLPPATGPPLCTRAAAQPTGPPHLSA